jgi:pimeloyl-ACP methyl ester carboxylesterase
MWLVSARLAPTDVADVGAGRIEYRWDRRGDRTVVVLHAGHMRAAIAVGEEPFVERDCTVLVPSRPGYGRTPVTTGTSPEGFADAIGQLCEHLGIRRVAAAVGVSAGGPTAIAMAARHSDLVQRLVLASAVGVQPWPDRLHRIMATVLFRPRVERVTWAAMGGLPRVSRDVGLRVLLRDLSTKPVGAVVAALGPDTRDQIVELFASMRSGRGFLNDLHQVRNPSVAASHVSQPALIVATRSDRSVPFVHAETLARALPHSELVVSAADTHFIWFGGDYSAIASTIADFVAAA